ncbi:MAG TPA: hypothetical protein VI488_13865 [Candidatus Angelobacter sp.]
MKSPLFSKLMTFMTAALLATGAFAAGVAHKGTLEVSNPVMVNGKQLPPGTYTIVWDGDGPDTSLHVMKGKTEVATAPCKVVALDQKASEDATEVKTSSAGRELSAVRFSGQKYQLDITGDSSRAQMKGNSVK